MNVGDSIFVVYEDNTPYPALITRITKSKVKGTPDTIDATVFAPGTTYYYAGPVAATAAAAERDQEETGHPHRAYITATAARRKTPDKADGTAATDTPED